MAEHGFIGRIQRFSLGDGPGIRTSVFMQGCDLRCPWCHNPETIPRAGALLLYERLCRRCGQCREVCPRRLVADCRIPDRTKCELCGACAQSCPNGAIMQSGTKADLESVFATLLEDKAFYDESGGGVTLTGGEPLLQADFCAALAAKCARAGVGVIVDTAGDVPFAAFEKLLPFTDCFYYDIKTLPDGYAVIGGNGARVYDNLRRLCALRDVVVRIPLIPGFNDDATDAISNVLHDLRIKEIHHLPFHNLATGKYKALVR